MTADSVDLLDWKPYCCSDIKLLFWQNLVSLSLINDSKSLFNEHRTEIGRKLSARQLSPDLNTGITFAIFNKLGNTPLSSKVGASKDYYHQHATKHKKIVLLNTPFLLFFDVHKEFLR